MLDAPTPIRAALDKDKSWIRDCFGTPGATDMGLDINAALRGVTHTTAGGVVCHDGLPESISEHYDQCQC